jgi:hypothetical protein
MVSTSGFGPPVEHPETYFRPLRGAVRLIRTAHHPLHELHLVRWTGATRPTARVSALAERRWWQLHGLNRHSEPKQLLISAYTSVTSVLRLDRLPIAMRRQ